MIRTILSLILITFLSQKSFAVTLKEALVEAYKNMKGAIYEIENCVRDRDLPSLVGELQECLEDMFNHLDNIDTDREFETVDYDGE